MKALTLKTIMITYFSKRHDIKKIEKFNRGHKYGASSDDQIYYSNNRHETTFLTTLSRGDYSLSLA